MYIIRCTRELRVGVCVCVTSFVYKDDAETDKYMENILYYMTNALRARGMWYF